MKGNEELKIKNKSELSFEERLLFFSRKACESANNPLITPSSREIHRHMAKAYLHSLKIYRETNHVKPLPRSVVTGRTATSLDRVCYD